MNFPRIPNVLDRMPKKRWPQAKVLLREAIYPPTSKEAGRLKDVFAKRCEQHGCSDTAAQLRTTAANRCQRMENATAVLWRTLLVAESRFRKLNTPELHAEVTAGVRFENGEHVRIRENVRMTTTSPLFEKLPRKTATHLQYGQKGHTPCFGPTESTHVERSQPPSSPHH